MRIDAGVALVHRAMAMHSTDRGRIKQTKSSSGSLGFQDCSQSHRSRQTAEAAQQLQAQLVLSIAKPDK